jgi:hypothetical protein
MYSRPWIGKSLWHTHRRIPDLDLLSDAMRIVAMMQIVRNAPKFK